MRLLLPTGNFFFFFFFFFFQKFKYFLTKEKKEDFVTARVAILLACLPLHRKQTFFKGWPERLQWTSVKCTCDGEFYRRFFYHLYYYLYNLLYKTLGHRCN